MTLNDGCVQRRIVIAIIIVFYSTVPSIRYRTSVSAYHWLDNAGHTRTSKETFLRTPGQKWSRRELSLVLLSDCFTMVYYGSLYCGHICYAIWYCIRQAIGEKSWVNLLCRKFKAISFVWALALDLNRHGQFRCTA